MPGLDRGAQSEMASIAFSALPIICIPNRYIITNYSLLKDSRGLNVIFIFILLFTSHLRLNNHTHLNT